LRCRVPGLIGLRLAQARQRIRRAHCSVGRVRRVRSHSVGRVIGQRPLPGAVRRANFAIRLAVGRR
jgi:beta-lactam-binding protein with PASTA domain